MRRIAPDLQLVYLVETPARRALHGAALPAAARIIGPGLHLIRADPSIVRRLHDAGNAVHVWTVDDPADVDLCVSLGVDAIITNRPAAVLTQLGRI
jgi:glycerophosphoryl diester phosphodiesterase